MVCLGPKVTYFTFSVLAPVLQLIGDKSQSWICDPVASLGIRLGVAPSPQGAFVEIAGSENSKALVERVARLLRVLRMALQGEPKNTRRHLRPQRSPTTKEDKLRRGISEANTRGSWGHLESLDEDRSHGVHVVHH